MAVSSTTWQAAVSMDKSTGALEGPRIGPGVDEPKRRLPVLFLLDPSVLPGAPVASSYALKARFRLPLAAARRNCATTSRQCGTACSSAALPLNYSKKSCYERGCTHAPWAGQTRVGQSMNCSETGALVIGGPIRRSSCLSVLRRTRDAHKPNDSPHDDVEV